MVGIGTAILVVAALGIAAPIFAPLTFALFIIAIVWPLQARLQARLPKLVALAISMLATIVVIGAFAWVITWGFSRVGRYIVTDAARFQLLYNQMTDWLEGHGIVVESLWAEHFNVGWVLRALPGDHHKGERHAELLARCTDLRHPRSHGSRRRGPQAARHEEPGSWDVCC